MIRHRTRRTASILVGVGSTALALVALVGAFGGTVLAAGGSTPALNPLEGTPPAPAGPAAAAGPAAPAST